ncbi:MurR/RpiR family transcriptional regulator [Listeria booriae]|uniref:MurR/RpiR family transcriptional regulator n=1 Tax=Listeria booriae TaxID=1552123 RepID=UPI001629F602|nr:MurR/RpiR family transcriptional regulator [Listeria booriae]MBC1293222.1 MurR/RpiR family transcriptional regulator [Listeria booriae]MBC1648872.1 MurR/RpiR family transcriptional regulator [Listeria booriae]MBC1943375.1 MurR/RpiR family transcriptional regulator [Listeria booriae]MBC6163809.1 MurR/RpiR family transcriptional regulator [Listeria booriae]MBC6166124.1 MurR/RpiR family transcriptional regulator [Listeria booriae]
MKSGIVQLQALAKQSMGSYQDIAKYIVTNAETVKTMHITQLADECYTSPATIVRMCKKLGYKGYTDFKQDLVLNLHKWFFEKQEVYNRGYIYPNKAAIEIGEVITNLTINGMIKSVQFLDSELVTDLAKILYEAERIDFYGCGISNLVAQDFSYRFLRAGKNTSAFADSHIQISQAQQSDAGCVAVGISYSGETKEVIASLEIAKQLGAYTISFTSDEDNSLAQVAECNITVAQIEHPEGYVAAASRIEMLHVMDIIYSVYASTYDETIAPKISRTRPYFKKRSEEGEKDS